MKPLLRLCFALSAVLLLSDRSAAQAESGGECQKGVCPLKQSAPEHSAPEQAAPDQTAPDQTAPERTAPEQADAEQAAPDQASPGAQSGQAAQAQPSPEAQGQPVAGKREIEGNVSHVATMMQDFRVVDPETGRILTLDVEETTEITRGGQKIVLDQIREGAEVRVSYELRGNEYVAERVEVSEARPEAAQIVEEARPGQPPLLALTGRITDKSDMNADFKIVDSQRRLAVTLESSDQTSYTMDGRNVSFQVLVPGQQVRATYRASERGDLVAQQVEILGEAQVMQPPAPPAVSPPPGASPAPTPPPPPGG